MAHTVVATPIYIIVQSMHRDPGKVSVHVNYACVRMHQHKE